MTPMANFEIQALLLLLMLSFHILIKDL